MNNKKGFTPTELIFAVTIMIVLAIFVCSVVKPTLEDMNTGTVSTSEKVQLPEPNWVVDDANVIGQDSEERLIKDLEAFDLVAQIAVVTVKSTKPLEIEEYGIRLAEYWKVGYEGRDNGIILIVATEDRQVRIEVGRGLEGVINDAKAGQILDKHVVPYLKEDKWEEGIMQGVYAIIDTVKEVNNE